MPCYEPREETRTEIIYETGISPEEFKNASEKAKKMEGIICALLNELERREIAEEIITEASRNGLIDIMSIWEKHRNDDFSRLAEDLHRRYSKDEQAILKILLSDNPK